MHFPKVKMVGKIQYSNYHGEILNFFGFKFLVPLSDCQQIVQTFSRRKNYNGVKIDGKICFREDIDAFIRMHKLINLQNNENNELKWLQSQSLKPEGVAEIPENILPEFSLTLMEGRGNAFHKEGNPRLLISDLALLSGKNWLNLEVIEVFISMINKIRPECKVISAPAIREYSRNYNTLIEKVKLWKKQGVETFCFIINVRLDKSGVIRASSMVSGNHWSCVHFNLRTGDRLYADSIG